MSFEKEIEKICQLAHLELRPEEKKRLAKELSSILDYFASLQEAEIKGVKPCPYPLDLKNVFRRDEDEERIDTEELKKAFPQQENGYLKIKSVSKEWQSEI